MIFEWMILNVIWVAEHPLACLNLQLQWNFTKPLKSHENLCYLALVFGRNLYHCYHHYHLTLSSLGHILSSCSFYAWRSMTNQEGKLGPGLKGVDEITGEEEIGCFCFIYRRKWWGVNNTINLGGSIIRNDKGIDWKFGTLTEAANTHSFTERCIWW